MKMSDGGKGDQRRPGKMPEGTWERIFNKLAASCTRCGGAHALSECKWPRAAEDMNQDREK